ncbi:hypothetical protein WJX81_001969 [Elliptochloris bilobata]|uniref:CN hydrolase domain-containing protein n=1 Tax=Elliptochloris bilobata TaxID=381761 RepID=A0AAW1SEL9_9CHLO
MTLRAPTSRPVAAFRTRPSTRFGRSILRVEANVTWQLVPDKKFALSNPDAAKKLQPIDLTTEIGEKEVATVGTEKVDEMLRSVDAGIRVAFECKDESGSPLAGEASSLSLKNLGSEVAVKVDGKDLEKDSQVSVGPGSKIAFGDEAVFQVERNAFAHASTGAASQRVQPPPAKKVKIALCQLKSSIDKAENIKTATCAVKEAAAAGAQLVVLPEMWNCPYSNDSFPGYAEDVDAGASPSADALAAAAAASGVTLVGGSIPERSAGRLFNTCLVYSAEGRLLAKHRKVHLFDIDIPGGITFRESNTLSPGGAGTVVDTDAGRLGIGICYDIRFPELAMLYANRGAQLLVYPGAFNMTTGPAHWELLQRARAVDNQLFVATCSPARNPDASYQAWGHSTVVSPWAEVLATLDEKPGIVYADLDYAELETRRLNMPVADQKRGDLYLLVDKSQAAA